MGTDKQTDKTKISLKIDTDKKEIKIFTKTINSFGDIVYETIKKYDTQGNYATIYVEKLDHGSFVIDFLCTIEPIMPTILSSFVELLFNKINELWKKLLNEEQPETTHELIKKKNTADMVEVITNNSHDNMIINININGNNNAINFNNIEANKAVNFAKTLKIKQEKTIYKKLLMHWEQKNFNDKKSGNKATIPYISSKPLTVSFENKDIEKEMTTTHPKFPNVEWQNLWYTVNLEYITLDGKPQLCNILKNYSELMTINECLN